MIENRAGSYQLNDFLMHYITIIVLTFEEHSFPFIPFKHSLSSHMTKNRYLSVAFLQCKSSLFDLKKQCYCIVKALSLLCNCIEFIKKGQKQLNKKLNELVLNLVKYRV